MEEIREKRRSHKYRGRFLQSLGISCEPGETEQEPIVDFVDPLEVCSDRLELNSEPPIAGDGEAVLPHHGY